MKKIYSLLIFLGVSFIIYPFLQEKYYDWQQVKVMDDLEMLQSDLTKVNHTFEKANQNPISMESEIEDADVQQDVSPGAVGIIEIDKIDIRLPILEDATADNMKVTAAHLVETSPIGEEGNAAIAAHRAHKKGRLFNRLGELEIGDQIEVTLTDQSKTVYVVDKISVVEPTDLSVLEDPHLGKVLTLITCDPLINPTHRLIVRAVIDKENTKV
ncbi:class D sortase [Paenibacillus sp. JNUCC31]|uniref:class D sortase n=1 Tax=Paenibacillus sp. JNUCC-31 TaxID=2777983 RepID=UPI001784DD43|nr:class D sortase [Paenibacillus sp. JNUCC-31]QOS79575.1 class D sortase [Paenibacillus sp. JNUCC-31]